MMVAFYIDAFLSILTYAILLGFIFKRFRDIKGPKNDDDDEGGLLFDPSREPVLDLPPGVVLPSQGPVHSLREEELV